MSNNTCLVTKLKAAVDNPELPILGEFKIQINPLHKIPVSGWLVPNIFLTSAEDFYVEVIDDNVNHYITNQDGSQNLGKRVDKAKNLEQQIGFTNPSSAADSYYVRVVSKYGLKGIRNHGYNMMTLNIDDLKYCTDIARLNFGNQGQHITGNIENLDLAINAFSIGNAIYTPYTLVEGRLEKVLEKLFNKGQHSDTISVQMFEPAQPNLTFLGNMLNTNAKKDLRCTFTENSITVVDSAGEGATIGVYNGSTWSVPSE